MFEALLWAAILICALGMVCAFDRSRDVFHPLVFIAPMMAFIYGWMPLKLLASNGLSRYFDSEQLVFVQLLNVAGLACFVIACLAAGIKTRKPRVEAEPLSPAVCRRLLIGAAITGAIGLLCWTISIINVGGPMKAFSVAYGGGWDDSGYIRDGSLLLLVGVLLVISAMASEGLRPINVSLFLLFGLPWLAQAILTARRGPTFSFAVIVLMGWYLNRRRRPPVIAVGAAGFLLGWLVLFLLANRGNIYLGSDFDVNTDVTQMVEKPDTGNEFVYGTGAVITAQRRSHYFWMRRYLAQILVRPIPSSIWPTKWDDFGVPEIHNNGGTGEGFGDALGWVGAIGSAPGIIADLWLEIWYFALPAMALLGFLYGRVWRKALTSGPAWASEYVILSALSIYMVMQTMEAILFRTIMLSVPCWIAWKWALRAPQAESDDVGLLVASGEWMPSSGKELPSA
jgi:hypothetical protein